MKRQPSEWEKIIANETTDRDYFPKHASSSSNLIPEKQTTQSKIGQKTEQIFLLRDIQIANKHMKRCLTSLISREMQIKPAMRYYLTLVTVTYFKKATNNKCWRRCREKGSLLHCWWECKLIQPLWKTVQRFLKKKKKKTGNETIWHSNLTIGIYLEETTNQKRLMYLNVHCNIIYNSEDMEAT